MPMQYDTLSSLTPVVRREVLTGELSRRLKDMDIMPATEVDSVVDQLVGLSLSEIVSSFQDPVRLSHQIDIARSTLGLRPIASSSGASPTGNGNGNGVQHRKSPSPSNSQDSRLLGPDVLNATASAPDHPSTPISVSVSSTPPRTSSPSGSIAQPTSEKERIRAAVEKLEGPEKAAKLTELMMTLPKRDRALCLFNGEILRNKIQDAKIVLESLEEDDEEEEQTPAAAAVPLSSYKGQGPTTPARKTTSLSQTVSPRTPDLSSRGPSAAASPVPVTPTTSGITIGAGGNEGAPSALLKTLADQRAEDVLKILREGGIPGVEAEDPLVRKATDEFVESLKGQRLSAQKSQAGDRVCVFVLVIDRWFVRVN